MGLAIGAIFVAAVVATIYYPVLYAEARHCDDSQYLFDNYLVRNPSWTAVGRFFGEVLEPSTVRGYYQPLAMLSLMLDCSAGGGPQDLRPFHRTSLILHVVNSLLVLLLFYLLLDNTVVAVAIALFFGLHPLTVEPVAWVGERKTLLAAMFSLAAIICHVCFARSSRLGWRVGTAAAYVLALLSKPTSTLLPLMLLLLDIWPLNRWGRRAIIEKLPLFLFGTASAIVTFISQRQTAGAILPGEQPWLVAPLRVCHNSIFYLHKTLWPDGLSPLYPVPESFGLRQPAVIAGVVGTALLIGLAVWSWRRSRAVAIGLLVYLVALFPTMQVVAFSDAIAADKYAYLPMVGILLIAAWALTMALSRKALRVAIASTVLLVVAAEALATRAYIGVWGDTERLCARMLQCSPRSAAVHNHLGLYYKETGHMDGAVREFRRALEIHPGLPEALNNLGLILAQQGRMTEAAACWRQSLLTDPRDFTAHYNLGTTCAESGDFADAEVHLTAAVEARPAEPDSLANLGAVQAQLGKLKEAAQTLQRAVTVDPASAASHANLGSVLARLGRQDEAVSHYADAARLQPGSATAWFTLGDALREAGRKTEARDAFRQVLRLAPNDAEAAAQLRALETPD